MIDTAGTICQAAELLVERGARSVMAAATHAVFSGPAVDRLKNSVIDKVIVTNTLPILGAAAAGNGVGVFLQVGANSSLKGEGTIMIPPDKPT